MTIQENPISNRLDIARFRTIADFFNQETLINNGLDMACQKLLDFNINPSNLIQTWNQSLINASKQGHLNQELSVTISSSNFQKIQHQHPKTNIGEIEDAIKNFINWWLADSKLNAIPIHDNQRLYAPMYLTDNKLYDWTNNQLNPDGYWKIKFNVQIIKKQI